MILRKRTQQWGATLVVDLLASVVDRDWKSGHLGTIEEAPACFLLVGFFSRHPTRFPNETSPFNEGYVTTGASYVKQSIRFAGSLV